MHKKNGTMHVSVSYVKNTCVSCTMRESWELALDITRVELSSSEEPCQCWHYCLYSEVVEGLQMLSHYYCFSNWLGWQNSLYFSTDARTYFWAEETKITKKGGWSYYIIIVFIHYAWFFISFSLHLQHPSFSSSPLLPPLPFSPFLFPFPSHHSLIPRGSVWVRWLLCTSLSTKLLFKRGTVYSLWWTLPQR